MVFQIVDGVAVVDVQLLVVGFNPQHIVNPWLGIEVSRLALDFEVVELRHFQRVVVEETTVGLQVNATAVGQEFLVRCQEKARCQAFFGAALLHLRVGEGYPDFAHLVGGEKRAHNLDACAEEGHIRHLVKVRRFGSGPDAGALNVNADEILVGEHARHANRVLAFAAAELQHYRIVVFEYVSVPSALERVRKIHKISHFWLKNIAKSLVLPEFCEFAFSHGNKSLEFNV